MAEGETGAVVGEAEMWMLNLTSEQSRFYI
jgi:hypothetical protein